MDERAPERTHSSTSVKIAAGAPPTNGCRSDAPYRRRSLLWCTWTLGGLFLLYGAVLNMRFANSGASDHFRVFGTFWSSGWAASHHMDPYAIYPMTLRFHPFSNNLVITDLNLSPPAVLPYLSGWALIDPILAARVWALFSVLLFLVSAALLLREYGSSLQHRQLFWLLLGASAFDVILSGQDYALFLALAVGGWLLFRRNLEVSAGICLGILVAAKPDYALWPIFLALGGHARLAKVAFLTFAVLCFLPVVLYGPGVYVSWLHAISHDPHWLFPAEVSIFGFASRLGHPYVGRAISVLVLVFACALVVWKRPLVEVSSGVALTVAILSSPVAWVHYSLLLAPILLQRRWTTSFTWAIIPLLIPGFLLARLVQGVAILSAAIHVPGLASAFANLYYFVPICFLLVYYLRETLTRPQPGPALSAEAAA